MAFNKCLVGLLLASSCLLGVTQLFTRPVQANQVALKTIQELKPGQSVGTVQLGQSDAILKQAPFGLTLSTSGKDTEYEGQTVYYYFFGPKDKNNAYALQVYSDLKHKIFIFEINSPEFKTDTGIHVGSSEADLIKAYGKTLKKQARGRIYVKYSLGDRKGTDFYVREGKISQILIRDY